MISFEATIQKLRSEGFKLTPQRLAVIRYMLGNKEHPSALKIHKELRRKYPTLSFSTVYNTLGTLEKIGEVQSLHIFDDFLNYEPNTDPHFHLLCQKCGAIHDVFTEAQGGFCMPLGDIDGHEVTKCSVILGGVCRLCR